MKQIKWPFLLLAIAAVLSMMGIGIAISYRSILGISLAIVAVILVMGFGFMTKKKMRESGEL